MLEKTILQKKLVLLYFKDSECYHDELNDVALKTESSDYPKGHVSDVVYVMMNKDYKSYCTWFSNHNYIFGEDYIDYIAYLVCLRKYQNKKEVRFLFAYGNCQVKYTVDCIKRYFHQSCDYFIEFMPLQEVCSWTDKRFELLCSICDYFFFTKEQFVVRYRNLEEYIIEHNPDCKMIAFPCYEFRGYFPQTDENVLRRNPFDIIRDYYNPFHRADLFLNGLIDKGVPENEILRTILKES